MDMGRKITLFTLLKKKKEVAAQGYHKIRSVYCSILFPLAEPSNSLSQILSTYQYSSQVILPLHAAAPIDTSQTLLLAHAAFPNMHSGL